MMRGITAVWWRRRAVRVAAIAWLILAALLSGSCWAQIRDGSAVPRDIYFLALRSFYAGEYRDALRGFQSAARSGVRSSEGRWVDSICYYAMIGECNYHLGDLDAALQQHEAALRLLLAHSGWMKRLQFPPAVPPAQIAGGLPWGPSTRPCVPGQFPETVLSLQGTDIDRVVRQGGIVAPPELYPLRVIEIFRCVAVSLQRRRELLGPVGAYDRLNSDLERELAKRPFAGNHWAGTLLNVQLAIAKATAGDRQEAIDLLRQSLVVGGQLDHPLTGVALVELGKLLLEQQEWEAAGRCFFDATFPAALFGQGDVLEDAFRLATQMYMRTGGQQLFPPLENAAVWAKSQGYDRAAASILLDAAENSALLNATRECDGWLRQVRRATGRSDLAAGRLGARFQYITALAEFQGGKTAAGQSALAGALKSQARLSERLLQIRLVDNLHRTEAISDRIADLLYNETLGEPTAQDWQTDPFNTLLVQVSDLQASYNRWLEISMARRDLAALVLVSDLVRRQKFYQELPLGGRLLALRWVVEAPDVLLDEATRLQRQELFARFPRLNELSRSSNEARSSLQKLPVFPEAAEQTREQIQYAQQLLKDSQQQEQILAEIALRPEPATRLFPPLKPLDQLQAQLKPGQTILGFSVTSREVHAILITAGKRYEQWPLTGVPQLKKSLVELVREMGNYDRNQVMNASLLASEKWKASAEAVFKPLAEKLTPEVLQETQELIIVPDGFLWYLPFEVLQVPTARGPQALIELTAIRYAPTLSLAVSDPRPTVGTGATAIAVGRLFGPDTAPILEATVAEIQQLRPQAIRLREPLPAPSSVLAGQWDTLLVLEDLDDATKSPWNWAPAAIDRGQPGSSLADWLQLPWDGPAQIVLPGFPTAAETGLRMRTTGDEIFLSVCGLMASGSRSVVLSRWRTGGRTSMELLREFLQEMPREAPAVAWQRAIQLTRSAPLDPTAEPRLKGVTEGQVPSAEHPFFWAGYLLIDASSPPARQ